MSLSEFDAQVIEKNGADCIIGVDEVGRGPLAGPVTACACILPRSCWSLLSEVNDSKKLSPAKREKLFPLLAKEALFAVSFVPPEEIDRINILNATMLAMRNAVSALKAESGAYVLVDGNKTIPGISYRQEAVVGGDAKSLSIAAASVIAKVLRDRRMQYLDFKYPGYGFAGHKGYGTASHMDCIAKLGVCPEHRKTFVPDRLLAKI